MEEKQDAVKKRIRVKTLVSAWVSQEERLALQDYARINHLLRGSFPNVSEVVRRAVAEFLSKQNGVKAQENAGRGVA
jgi:hypothetical protein